VLASLAVLSIVLGVAYVTLADRKGMAILQRRVGPNAVGIWGVLQPFADALKLLTKELVYVDNIVSGLSQVLPAVTLSCSLANYAVLPFGQMVALLDTPLQLLVTLALMGLALHGVLYMAWGAGNSYSFLGSIRAVAQLVSYELPLTAVLFVASLQANSFHYSSLWLFNSA
jgi:NADH:ubiquinone oxidoreductase subunit H